MNNEYLRFFDREIKKETAKEVIIYLNNTIKMLESLALNGVDTVTEVLTMKDIIKFLEEIIAQNNEDNDLEAK